MTDAPRRIQRKRAKGWSLPPNTKCVDRSTKWGNPFVVGQAFVRPHMTPGGGEISGVVQVGSRFCVLKLQQRIPAPPAVYDEVKEQLRKDLYDRLIEQEQLRLLSRLSAQADVEYIHHALRKAVKETSRP